MNPLTEELVNKVEGDFNTAERELRVTNEPNYDAVCFHAQQGIEKYLKAKLHEVGVQSGKTHDLSLLLDLVLPVEPSWSSLRPDLQALTVFAVAYRYPGDSADENEAHEAMTKCRNIRQIIRTSLNI